MAKKGGGGSQLAQLKARLHGEGVTDRRQMRQSAKKRKRGQAGQEKEDQQVRRDKLARIAASAQFNPFEEKVTKPKNVVLGRYVRGATGRPGEARQGGLQERRETLLPEWRNRNKSGTFVDKRFGEANNSSISREDAMLERFTRERQKRASKTSMFNLDDAEEEGLTHYGKSLNDMDQYDDMVRLSDEEADEDRMAHFGGFDDQQGEAGDDDDPDRQKTKAEVMKELIAKSKAHKFERQQVKMADEELRQQLDDDFGDLRSLLMESTSMSKPVKEAEKNEKGTEDAEANAKKAKETAYDAAVREMVYERRAKPQDRLKTEAEKAQELSEKLQRAEKDRLRRMRGEEAEADEINGKRGRNARRPVGGDDLEDDFELDGMTSSDVYGLGQGLGALPADDAVDESDEEEEEEVESGEEDAEDEGDEDSEDEDEDEDDDEDDFADLADAGALAEQGEDLDDAEDDKEGEEQLVGGSKKGMQAAASRPPKSASTLPFTFPCPADVEELQSILRTNRVNLADVPLVIKRIRALHHASLDEANKERLQTLIGVLLDYILHISLKMTQANRTATVSTINQLVPQLYALTKAYPIAAAEHFVGKLALVQRNLVRGLSRGPTHDEARTWPGLAECMLLRITSTVWPTSDRTHPVSTPLALLIAQYLSACRIRHLDDLIKGLYLCAVVVDNERQSKRIVPEALNFLHNALSLLLPITSTDKLRQLNQRYAIPWPDVVSEHVVDDVRLTGEAVHQQAPDSVDLFAAIVESAPRDTTSQQSLRGQALVTALRLTEAFAHAYVGSVAYVEMFTPFVKLLALVPADALTASHLAKAMEVTTQHLGRTVQLAQRQRRALRLQAHRAIPIASHVPKFNQGFNPERKGGRTFDPDAERSELAKLRALQKKERKGAMRELRRDNEFLTDVRREAREEEDKRYAKQMDKIMGSLSAERGEEKAYLREKKKLKRRAGKK